MLARESTLLSEEHLSLVCRMLGCVADLAGHGEEGFARSVEVAERAADAWEDRLSGRMHALPRLRRCGPIPLVLLDAGGHGLRLAGNHGVVEAEMV
jgi:hypothetical protein